MLKRYKLKNYNFRLVLWLVILSSIGVMLVGSAMQSLQKKQMFGVIGGIVLMLIISLMDFSWILNFYWVIYIVNILQLLAVYAFGAEKYGASRWIDLKIFQFQPTELAKILIVLFFAMFLMKHEDDLNTFKTIAKAILLLAPPLLLIYFQPDVKNTITVLVIFCLMLYAAGLSYKIIGGVIVVAVPLVAALLFLITQTDLKIVPQHAEKRIMTFFYGDVNEEYSDARIQQDNSIMAIGSGRLRGKGLNNNKVSSANKGNFVSMIHNDFIFAVAGEELGFIGSTAIVLLLFLIVFECIQTGRRAKDLSGTLICCGVASVVGIQGFINLCVATGIFPNTGTPLPFVSYGLTSLWSLYIGMGFVLNVGLQTRNYMGEKRNEYRIDRT